MQFRTSPSAHNLGKLCDARMVAKYVWGYDADVTPEQIRAKHKLEPIEFGAALVLFTRMLREDRPAAEKRKEWREAGWSEAPPGSSQPSLYDDISLHAKAEEGKRLHKLIQAYLVDGWIPPPEEKAARKCIEVLPLKGGSVARSDIERVVLMDQHTGYMDYQRAAWVGDLKFTVSVEHQRQVDPTKDAQRIIYAIDAFERDPRLEVVKCFWTVTEFTGKRALTLKHKWTKDAALAAYDAVITPRHFRLMEAYRTQLHWQDAEKNQESCDMYPPNGCVMKQHGCRRSLAQRLLAIRPKGKSK